MSFLLDTNVVSEARRRSGDPRVKAWLRSASSGDLYLSVLVVGEIRRGIERLRSADPIQARALERWLEDLGSRFGDRVMPIDQSVAETWGRLSAVRPLPVEDALMAATALRHGMTLVTRNVRDVADLGVAILNPWG